MYEALKLLVYEALSLPTNAKRPTEHLLMEIDLRIKRDVQMHLRHSGSLVRRFTRGTKAPEAVKELGGKPLSARRSTNASPTNARQETECA